MRRPELQRKRQDGTGMDMTRKCIQSCTERAWLQTELQAERGGEGGTGRRRYRRVIARDHGQGSESARDKGEKASFTPKRMVSRLRRSVFVRFSFVSFPHARMRTTMRTRVHTNTSMDAYLHARVPVAAEAFCCQHCS